jgi:hypothetical protein
MGRLSPGQLAHFSTFGFLQLPAYFSGAEVCALQRTALELSRGWTPSTDPDERMGLVETDELLTTLLVQKVLLPLRQLLGDGFVWSGSELNVDPLVPPGSHQGAGALSQRRRVELKLGQDYAEHNWHSDRPGLAELGYLRIKVFVYLTPTTAQRGALRLIPGAAAWHS